MPASHLPVAGSQIGQGWMNVLQVLPGQSASVMHPKPPFAPPTQLPVSQVPEKAQSESWQHGVFGASPKPGAQRPVSLTQVPPGQEPTAIVPQPPPPVQFAPAVEPPEQRIGMRSPARKVPELSGSVRPLTLPVEQSEVPVAFAVAVLMTHVLVAAPLCEELGIGSGGPKRQPAFVHLVWAHFALLQTPALHVVAPGVQSAVVMHVEAQSASARHDVPNFDEAPRVQRFPPASLGLAPVSVTVVPVHEALTIELP